MVSTGTSPWKPTHYYLFVILISTLAPHLTTSLEPFTFLLSKREWVVGESEGVGTRVATLRPMMFGGGPVGGITYVVQKGPNGDVDLSKYFHVDKAGNVVIKQTLTGLSGVSGSVYVGAEGEGIISFKTEAHVTVVHEMGDQHDNNNQMQPPPPPRGGGAFSYPPPPRPSYFTTPTTPTKPTTTEAAAAATKDDDDQEGTAPSSSTAAPSTTSTSTSTSTPSTTTTVSVSNPDHNKTSSGEEGVYVAVVTCVLVVVLLVGLTGFVVRRRRQHPHQVVKKTTTPSSASAVGILGQWVGKRAHSNRYEDSGHPGTDLPVTASTTAASSSDKWELPRGSLKIVGMLGEGCFGQVWRCEQTTSADNKTSTTTVAVKTLKESAGPRERSDLLSELAVMKTLEPHPNVVRLLGCCTADEDQPIFLVMEFVALGKLQTFLRESRDSQCYYRNLHSDSNSLSARDLTHYAFQCARGMQFLASKGIIHRDLAARNILLDADRRTCKVADFGFARDVVEGGVHGEGGVGGVYERKSDGRLPIRWMAPEALFDNLFTTKTDVWSFGVLMWEIVTLGSTPYPGLGASEVMKGVRDGGLRLEKPAHCRRELYNVMFYCWAALPADRPTFAELATFLSNLLAAETDYIQLDLFPDHAYYNMTSTSQIDEEEETPPTPITADDSFIQNNDKERV